MYMNVSRCEMLEITDEQFQGIYPLATNNMATSVSLS